MNMIPWGLVLTLVFILVFILTLIFFISVFFILPPLGGYFIHSNKGQLTV